MLVQQYWVSSGWWVSSLMGKHLRNLRKLKRASEGEWNQMKLPHKCHGCHRHHGCHGLCVQVCSGACQIFGDLGFWDSGTLSGLVRSRAQPRTWMLWFLCQSWAPRVLSLDGGSLEQFWVFLDGLQHQGSGDTRYWWYCGVQWEVRQQWNLTQESGSSSAMHSCCCCVATLDRLNGVFGDNIPKPTPFNMTPWFMHRLVWFAHDSKKLRATPQEMCSIHIMPEMPFGLQWRRPKKCSSIAIPQHLHAFELHTCMYIYI